LKDDLFVFQQFFSYIILMPRQLNGAELPCGSLLHVEPSQSNVSVPKATRSRGGSTIEKKGSDANYSIDKSNSHAASENQKGSTVGGSSVLLVESKDGNPDCMDDADLDDFFSSL
jgi:hypothetical protein